MIIFLSFPDEFPKDVDVSSVQVCSDASMGARIALCRKCQS